MGGGAVILMMEKVIGKETLTKGLNYYLTAMAYSASTEDDLFTYLEQAAVEDGVWPQTSGWDVPLTFSPVTSETSFEDPAQAWLLANADGPLVVDAPQLTQDTPFLVNIGVYGYYRVTYDEATWLSLADTLRTDFKLIPALNR